MKRVLKIEYMKETFFEEVFDQLYEQMNEAGFEEIYQIFDEGFKNNFKKAVFKILDDYLTPKDFFNLPKECKNSGNKK